MCTTAGQARIELRPPLCLAESAVAQLNGLIAADAFDRPAVEGLPLPQLRRWVAALLAAGRDVTFVGQAGESGTRVLARRPVARWLRNQSAARPFRQVPPLVQATAERSTFSARRRRTPAEAACPT